MIEIDEVENIISEMKQLPIIGKAIRPPKEIIFLDGTLKPRSQLNEPIRIIGRAHVASRFSDEGERLMIVTPASNEETVIHEVMHLSGIFNETLTQYATHLMQQRLSLKRAINPISYGHSVKYFESTMSETDVMRRLNITNPNPEPLRFKYYILEE